MAITIRILSVTVTIDGVPKQQAAYVAWDAGPTYHVSGTPAFAFQGNEAAVQTFMNASAQFYYDYAVEGNSIIPVGLGNRLDWLPAVAPEKMGRLAIYAGFDGWNGLLTAEQTALATKLNALRQTFYDILKAP